jgi:hypothetical protein
MPLWYYGSPAGQSGPVEDREMQALIASGGVGPETLVWRDGMQDWVPLRTMPELVGAGVTPYPPAYGGAGYYPPVTNSGLAIASMVCGIVGYVTCYFVGILGIPAVICGHMALSQIQNSAVPMSGRGMAIAGLVLGYLGIAISLACVTAFSIAILSAKP